MKPKYFIYSARQKRLISDYQPNKKLMYIFIDGEFVEYTEQKDSNKSNFDDAIYLGLQPGGWTKIGKVIQDDDLEGWVNKEVTE